MQERIGGTILSLGDTYKSHCIISIMWNSTASHLHSWKSMDIGRLLWIKEKLWDLIKWESRDRERLECNQDWWLILLIMPKSLSLYAAKIECDFDIYMLRFPRFLKMLYLIKFKWSHDVKSDLSHDGAPKNFNPIGVNGCTWLINLYP